jgi:hypothetical protein
MIDIKQAVKEAFNEAAVECFNGKKAINLSVKSKGNSIVVTFDVDCGRGGKHSGSSVTLTNEIVRVSLCEMIEGGGIEEIMSDNLTRISLGEIDTDGFKTIKEQIYDILNNGIWYDDDGYITGIPEATDKIAKLFE